MSVHTFKHREVCVAGKSILRPEVRGGRCGVAIPVRCKRKLINEAMREHERIFPCSGLAQLEECFTVEPGKVLFWFNTADDSTHIRYLAHG